MPYADFFSLETDYLVRIKKVLNVKIRVGSGLPLTTCGQSGEQSEHAHTIPVIMCAFSRFFTIVIQEMSFVFPAVLLLSSADSDFTVSK